ENQFHEFLISSSGAKHVREYLQDRGMTPETVRRFKLGYHPDNWEWLQNQARAKFSKEQMLAAKLIGERQERGGYYDFFVDRVMFPIHDPQGKTVAFGGRVLPGSPKSSMGKYWNSPESPLFTKSRIIYGLDYVRDSFKETNTAILMEGYMDCIMAQQAGVTNCVATLGTALTEQHVTILKRFVRTVVLVYDGDNAGQDAAEKSIPRFLAQELDLRILTLTGDQDPADVMLDQGAEWFLEQAAQAPEVWEFKLKRVIARNGTHTTDAAHRVVEEMLELLCEMPTHLGSSLSGRWQLREDILLGKLCQRLGIPEKNVRDRLGELRRQQTQRGANMNSDGGTPQSHATPSQIHRLIQRATVDEKIEAELLQIVLLYPETVNSIRQEISTKEITCAPLRQLWELCLELFDQQILPSIDQVLLRLEESELKPLAVWLDETARQRNVTPDLTRRTLLAVQRRRVRDNRHSPQDGPGATPDNLKINEPVDSKTLLRLAAEKQHRLHERRDAGL
ncbi:MAG: toprim domain-containing protein, partial [Planctomycetota bacterium]